MSEPVIEDGDLSWDVDDQGNDGAILQVDGSDVVSISDVTMDGRSHVIVWASSHPDSTIAWEGWINVRERQNTEEGS